MPITPNSSGNSSIPFLSGKVFLPELVEGKTRGFFSQEERRIFMADQTVQDIFEEKVEAGTSSNTKNQLEKIKIGGQEINAKTVSPANLDQARFQIQQSAAETLKKVYEKAGMPTNTPDTEVRIANFVNGVDLQARALIKQSEENFNVEEYFKSFLGTFEKFETAYKTGTDVKDGFGLLDKAGAIPNIPVPNWVNEKFGSQVQIFNGKPENSGVKFTQNRDSSKDTNNVMYFKMGTEIITCGRGFKDIQPIKNPLKPEQIIGFCILDGDGDMISVVQDPPETGALKRQFIDQSLYLRRAKKDAGDIINASDNKMRFFGDKNQVDSKSVKEFFSGSVLLASLGIAALSKIIGGNTNWGENWKTPEVKGVTEASKAVPARKENIIIKDDKPQQIVEKDPEKFEQQQWANTAFEISTLSETPTKQEILTLLGNIKSRRRGSLDEKPDLREVFEQNIQKLLLEKLFKIPGKTFDPQKTEAMTVNWDKLTLQFKSSSEQPIQKLVLGEGNTGIKLFTTPQKTNQDFFSAAADTVTSFFDDGSITDYSTVKDRLSKAENLLVSDSQIQKYTDKSLREGIQDKAPPAKIVTESLSTPQTPVDYTKIADSDQVVRLKDDAGPLSASIRNLDIWEKSENQEIVGAIIYLLGQNNDQKTPLVAALKSAKDIRFDGNKILIENNVFILEKSSEKKDNATTTIDGKTTITIFIPPSLAQSSQAQQQTQEATSTQVTSVRLEDLQLSSSEMHDKILEKIQKAAPGDYKKQASYIALIINERLKEKTNDVKGQFLSAIMQARPAGTAEQIHFLLSESIQQSTKDLSVQKTFIDQLVKYRVLTSNGQQLHLNGKLFATMTSQNGNILNITYHPFNTTPDTSDKNQQALDVLLTDPKKARKLLDIIEKNPKQRERAAILLWKLAFTKPSDHSANLFTAISAHTTIMSQSLDQILQSKGLTKNSLSQSGVITTNEEITLTVSASGIQYKKGESQAFTLSDEQAQMSDWKTFGKEKERTTNIITATVNATPNYQELAGKIKTQAERQVRDASFTIAAWDQNKSPLFEISNSTEKASPVASSQKILTALQYLDTLETQKKPELRFGYQDGTLYIKGNLPILSRKELKQIRSQFPGEISHIVIDAPNIRIPGGEHAKISIIQSPFLIMNGDRPEIPGIVSELKKAGFHINQGVKMSRNTLTDSQTSSSISESLDPQEKVKAMLRRSDNLVANQIFLLAGQNADGSLNLGNAQNVARAYAKSIGLTSDNIKLAEGSGIASADRKSPQETVTKFTATELMTVFAAFHTKYPQLLSEYAQNSDNRISQLVGKTGHVTGVDAFVGFDKTTSSYVFISIHDEEGRQNADALSYQDTRRELLESIRSGLSKAQKVASR